MVEAGVGRPLGESGFALEGEAFLEAFDGDASKGIAGRDGATGAGIAALEMDFADLEADGAALVFTEELIFPEGGDASDFEGGAEAEADIVDGESGKPFGDGLKGSGGDDGGAAGEGVVGKAAGGIADEDLLLEEHAEPFGGVRVAIGERKSESGNAATIAGNGESDGAEVGRVGGADEMDGGSTFAIDPAAVHGIEGPGAIEFKAAGRADAGFGNGDRVERFDGMETKIGQARGCVGEKHGKSLAEVGNRREIPRFCDPTR